MLIEGLGLFLFGMKLMSDGLENAAGERLKGILEKITSNRVMGVCVGALVTAAIQSSGATTVMVVSFVNAGLMTLMQAAGVIMGANIGTTITAQLVSFKLDAIAPLFIGIGAIILLLTKKKKIRDIASISLGFGILFLGISTMSDSMKPLAESTMFTDVIGVIGNNIILGIIVGFVMTALTQSSSVTTAVLVALATAGTITMNVALPVIFGGNIGSCVTALLAAIGSGKTAKKAALIHLLFNFIGVIIFIPFMNILINFVQGVSPDSVARQVANAHTLFNITVTIILLPLSRCLVLLVNKIIPGEDTSENIGAMYLDKKLIETPIVATGQAFKETVRMGELAKTNLELAMKVLLDDEDDDETIKKIYSNEEVINILEKEITNYLVLLSSHELPEEDGKILSVTFHVTNDIERIGDHAKNITELAIERQKNKVSIEGEAREELIKMYNRTLEAVTVAIEAYANKDAIAANRVKKIELSIDEYEKDLRENNISRLNKKICNANVSAIFLDLISNLERIGDHSTNIAERVE
jgi:phosphate:Na+ symporter